MTGQSNIRNYTHFSILDPKEKTFGLMMQRAGYRTAVAGKWQLYGAAGYGPLTGTGTHPRDAGFDEYCLWQIDRRQSRYWGPLIERNGRVLSDVEGRYGPDIFCEFIGEFLEKHKGHPVFVYYPMVLVHNPFVRTPNSKERQHRDRRANFADMVAYMDKIVGRIVARLDELGRRDNTLVLFTSDNGTNRAITSRANGREITGGKGLTTDAGTRVPLVASCPGFVSAGRVCEDIVDFSDFLPTLAEAAGAKLPPGVTIDGRSFLPQLKGQKGRPREWIFCYHNPRPGNRKWPERCFVRDQRWKLYRDGQLYDIQNDVLEQHPLKDGEGGAEAAAARKRLRAALDSMPAKPAKIGK
jgi:arylsulfatase A-like enzyme